ncbi:MAG: hypothetical protein ACOCRO_03180 [Halanaerobiales bacterium]
MLLVLLLIVVLMVCIFLFKYASENYHDVLEGVAVIIGAFVAVGVFVSLIIIADVQITKVPEYETLEMRKEIIEEKIDRIENHEDGIVNGDFGSLADTYDKAEDINSDIIKARYWSDNIWLNWYYNDLIADMELIDTK